MQDASSTPSNRLSALASSFDTQKADNFGLESIISQGGEMGDIASEVKRIHAEMETLRTSTEEFLATVPAQYVV